MWAVEYTDEFESWWNKLENAAQIDVAAYVGLLEQCGPNLEYPYSSEIKKSRHSHMRELRIQHCGQPFRVLYALDSRRCAILLIGGNKKGDNNWYRHFVPLADDLYDQHLHEINKGGFSDG